MFDPTAYGPVVAGLLSEPRLADLGPGSPVLAVRDALRTLDLPAARRAGLWLYFDFLHESHEISQDLDTPDGSFWHAVMHRREPDPSNSKYWWRKVGPHSVLEALVRQAPALGYHYTTPEAFVDFCERVRGTNSPDELLAKRVQLLEWQLLFDHCD
jgi:hypothetical protein